MSNETLNRGSATPSLSSKQISMSSVDISSLMNESTIKTSKSFDAASIEDEESKNDSKEIQGNNLFEKRIIYDISLF